MADDDKRPLWLYNDHMSEAEFRLLNSTVITKIEHKREMTGVDTERSWLVFHTHDQRKISRSIDFFEEQQLFVFYPDYRGLVGLSVHGCAAENNLRRIDDWERANDKDRAEYERLKAKFESK